MEASIAKRDRARRGHTETDKQVRPGKRRRSAEDEDTTEHTRKSPRIQESRHNLECKVQSPPFATRKSPRLQKIRDLKDQQRIARAGKQTRLSHRITKAHQSQGKRGLLRAARKSEQRRVPEDKVSNHNAKHPQHHDVREQACSTDEYIKNWLSTSCRSRRTSSDSKTLFREISDDIPRKAADVLPSPSDVLKSTISSRKSVKSAASVSDTDYRENSLRYRNIYIEREDPPIELVRRVTRIISRRRASPEIDDAVIRNLRGKSRKLQTEGEEEIIQQLVPDIIPAMKEIPDQRLTQSADKVWSNSVPIPLNPSVLISPLPLPKPKPSLAFGYSETAFTQNQLAAIDLLVDDQSGQSYAIPDQKLRFPFLDIEFKSQAKNGTHFIATNQVAGAGAIVLNGNLELIQRGLGAEKIDFDEPQFFSVTMDHETIRINVHWVSAPTDGGKYGFHVEGLLRHFLHDADGLRAIIRAIKNILDYGSDARLRKLCEALDAYREKVILEREAGTERHQEPVVQPEPQPERRRRSKRGTSTSTKAAGHAAGQGAT